MKIKWFFFSESLQDYENTNINMKVSDRKSFSSNAVKNALSKMKQKILVNEESNFHEEFFFLDVEESNFLNFSFELNLFMLLEVSIYKKAS